MGGYRVVVGEEQVGKGYFPTWLLRPMILRALRSQVPNAVLATPQIFSVYGYITVNWILKFLFIFMVVVFFKFLHPIEFSELLSF